MFGRKVIKIPGKTFNDLDATEVAEMIEADSALSTNGSDRFASNALDEFLSTTTLRRQDLLELQSYILRHIYFEQEGLEQKLVDKAFLLDTAKKVRSGDILIRK